MRLQAAAKGIGPQAVEQASAAVTAFYAAVGLSSPCHGPLCATAREAARRTLTAQPRDRDAVTAADMQALVSATIRPGCSLSARMHVTVLSLQYAGQLRFDDATKVMVHRDLMRIYPDRAELFIWRSKTDQHAKGAWVTIGRVPGPHCPVTLLRALLEEGGYATVPERPDEDLGPLLRAVTHDKRTGKQVLRQRTATLQAPIPPLSFTAFSASMHRLLKAAGVTKQLGTHSFRIGATTAAVNAGVEHTLVQKQGRWRDAHTFQAVYARDNVERRTLVTKAAYGLLPAAS